MARVSLRRATVGLAIALGALIAVSAQAAPPAHSAPPAKAKASATKSKKKETREGSYIVNGQPMPPPPDLRGTYEKARDDELITHYRRLAQLDYIEELATHANDTRLLERVESIRRRETQRHRGVMTRFSEQARARAMVGF